MRASCPLAGWCAWSPPDGPLKTASGQLSCCSLDRDAPFPLMVPRAVVSGGSLLLLTPVRRGWLTLDRGMRSCLPLLCESGAPELLRRLMVGLGCCRVAGVAVRGACAVVKGAPALSGAGWHFRSLSCCLFLSVAAPAGRQVPGGCSGIASLLGVACSGLLGCAEAGPQSASRDFCRAANSSSCTCKVTVLHIGFWCPASLWQYSSTRRWPVYRGIAAWGPTLLLRALLRRALTLSSLRIC